MSDDARSVYQQVQLCLQNLVGGSGHLASYSLDRASFTVTAERTLGDGCVEVRFSVTGYVQSEFDYAAPDDELNGEARPPMTPPRCSEQLQGALVLDAQGAIAVGDDGRVRLSPWRTLDPKFWLQC